MKFVRDNVKYFKELFKNMTGRRNYFYPIEKSHFNPFDLTFGNDQQKLNKLQAQYVTNPWVYSGIYAISTSGASLPIKIVNREDGSPFTGTLTKEMEFFLHPNSFLSIFDFIEGMLVNLETTGRNYIEVFDDGEKKEGFLLNPTTVKPIIDKDLGIVRYVQEINNGRRFLGTDQVIDTRYFNPLSDFIGHSPIDSAFNSLLLQFFVEKYKTNWFKNGGHLGGFFTTKESIEDEEHFLRLKEQLEDKFTGIQSAGKHPFLDAGVDFKKVTDNLKDAELSSIEDTDREKILAVLGVPPVMVGKDDSRYANADIQLKGFWRLTMKPKMMKIQWSLNDFFFKDSEQKMVFDFSGISELQQDMDLKSKIEVEQVKIGLRFINELRVADGLGTVPWGDVPPAINSTGTNPAVTKSTPKIKKQAKLQDGRNVNDLKKSFNGWIRGRGLERWKQKQENILFNSLVKTFSGIEKSFFKSFEFIFVDRDVLAQTSEFKKDAKDLKKQDSLFELLFKGLQEEINESAFSTSEIIKDIANKTFTQVEGVQLLEPDEFIRKLSPQTLNIIGTRIKTNISTTVFKTLTGRLSNSIQKSISAGDAIPTIEKNVKKIFDGYANSSQTRKGWARAIARTETGAAVNKATLESYKEGGVEFKQWLSTGGSNDRHWHTALDGVRVPVDKNFLLPNPNRGVIEVAHPLDMDRMGADDTVNCRCDIIPVYEEFADEFPPRKLETGSTSEFKESVNSIESLELDKPQIGG